MGERMRRLEIAAEVLAKAPHAPPISAEQLARLAAKRAVGTYIRISEYPFPEEELRPLIDHVIQWLWSEKRLEQVKHPDVWKVGCFDLIASPEACDVAQLLASRTDLSPSDIQRLPVEGCWRDCTCEWRWRRRG